MGWLFALAPNWPRNGSPRKVSMFHINEWPMAALAGCELELPTRSRPSPCRAVLCGSKAVKAAAVVSAGH